MRLATVVGQVVSTIKEQPLDGFKLPLLVDLPLDGSASAAGEPYVAVDLTGAGEGEVVLVASGGAARTGERSRGVPTDAAVVAIVDTVVLQGEVVFKKE